MNCLEYLPPKIAAIVRRNALLYGTPPEGWQYPTMEKLMEQDEMRKMQRECNAFVRQYLAEIAAAETEGTSQQRPQPAKDNASAPENQRNNLPT